MESISLENKKPNLQKCFNQQVRESSKDYRFSILWGLFLVL